MAGKRQSAASARRSERAASARRQRLIVYGAVGALGVVAAVIVVGLYLTQYRAPRAHVVTVGARDYNTSAVARRATYNVLFEGGLGGGSGIDVVARLAVNLLVNEEVVRRYAPATVGEVSDQDVEDELRTRLGLTDSDPAAFGAALATTIQSSGLSRDEYFAVNAAQILADRLREGFRASIPPAALQLHLSRIRLVDAVSAEAVRASAAAGEDFATLASERTADIEHRDDGGDLGWFTLDMLDAGVAAAVGGLAAGEVASVVPAGLFFDVYLATERDDDRPLDQDQIDRLVETQFTSWLDAQRAGVAVRVDLSSGEDQWIRDRIVGNLNHSLGR